MAKNKKNKKRSNLLVLVYAFFIFAMGVAFMMQSNKLEAQKNKNVNIASVDNATTQEKTKPISLLLPQDPTYSYELVDKSANPKMKIGDTTTLSLKVKNTGNQNWDIAGEKPTYLGTTRPEDRETVFYKDGIKGWFSGNRIIMDKKVVKPGQMVNFTFQITAPEASGIYREFFTPIVEKVKWLEDKNIYWDIEVRDPKKADEELKTTVNGRPIKYIKIKIKEQNLYAYENGLEKYVFRTSTGIAGMDTPTGEYRIWNKFPVQYSPPYQLYMDNWMAITQSGEYGIHSLPYWVYKDGSHVYEGEQHLGTPVSHGCIRTSLENSKTLYDWAEVGIPVIIEN